MIYIKRVANADVTRQIDLAKDSARIFFGFDESIPGLQYELIFREKYTNIAYGGKIAKKGHSVTIPGEFFSHIKANHKIDDIIVFESTNDPKLFLFHVFVPGEPHYCEYEALLENHGKYNGKIKKHTHLLWDEAQTIPDDGWVKTINNWIKKIEDLEGKEDKITESVARQLHSEWKELLAQNMMNLVRQDSRVVCPFTGVEGDYAKLPMLFIASHIKRFADSSLKEKYDINNGLLLTANADALFDKYMITVSEEKELVFSKFLDDDLKRVLNLMEIVMPDVLNEERMGYMKEHRRIFEEKERIRMSTGLSASDMAIESDAATHISDETQSSPNAIEFLKYAQQAEDPLPVAAEEEETYCVISSGNNNKGLKSMLLGCYKSQKHLQWILQNKMYNIRLGKRVGAMDISKDDLPLVTHIALYKICKHPKCRLFNVLGSRVVNGLELNMSGYPSAKEDQDYYVFELEPSKLHIQINVEELINQAESKIESYTKGMPIILD